jgi:hypothetical protein
MANYDFKEITATDGKKYLGTTVNGTDVFVYRCALHNAAEGIRKSIYSYKLIPGDSAIRKVLFPFIPILFQEKGSTNGLPDYFDYGDRDQIVNKHDSDRTEKHLRYQKWQIYLFIGSITNKDCTLPGLWELIPIDISQPLIVPPVTRPPGYGP